MFLHYIVQLKNIVFTNLIVIVIFFIIIIFFKCLLIWFIYFFLNFCTHDLENSSCIVTAPQSTEELIFNLCTVLLIVAPKRSNVFFVYLFFLLVCFVSKNLCILGEKME